MKKTKSHLGRLVIGATLAILSTSVSKSHAEATSTSCVERELQAVRSRIESQTSPTSQIDQVKTGFIYAPSAQGERLYISYVYRVNFAGGGILPIPPSQDTWAGQNTYDINCQLIHEGVPAVVR